MYSPASLPVLVSLPPSAVALQPTAHCWLVFACNHRADVAVLASLAPLLVALPLPSPLFPPPAFASVTSAAAVLSLPVVVVVVAVVAAPVVVVAVVVVVAARALLPPVAWSVPEPAAICMSYTPPSCFIISPSSIHDQSDWFIKSSQQQ